MIQKTIVLFLTTLTVFLIVPSGMVVSAVREGKYRDFEYSVSSDDLVTITKYTGSDETVTIPSKIDGSKVVGVGAEAFQDCESLKTLEVPNSIAEIGHHAFYGTTWYNSLPDGDVYIGSCYYIYKGDMPENTSISIKYGTEGIAEYAFENCKNLVSVRLPDSIGNIGEGAFKGCTNLKSVNVPNSVTEINSFVFSGCSSLAEIVVPYGVRTIGESAFDSCTNLTDIVLPKNVITIGRQAFQKCSGIQKLALPSSLKNVGERVFYACDGLEELYIPQNIAFIGEEMFGSCTNLKQIVMADSVERIAAKAFSDTHLENVYFGGSENNWHKINIGVSNESLSKATVYFLSKSHSQDTMIVKEDLNVPLITIFLVIIALLIVALGVCLAVIGDLKEKLRQKSKKPVRKK